MGDGGENIDLLDESEVKAEGVEGGDAGEARERLTTRYMTKYERARILGARAQQIAMGAPVMVELEGEVEEKKHIH